jgi:Zn-dependent protease with chaperone function
MSVDGDLNELGGPDPWPANARLPGRVRWLATCCGALAVSIAAVVVTSRLVPGVGADLAIFPLVQVVIICNPFARLVRLRQLLRDTRYRTVSADAPSAAALAAAGPSGVRKLTVRTGPVRGFARTYRAGHHAVFLVHERLRARPAAARFLMAHEAAHVARYDHLRLPSVMLTAIVCGACVAVTWGWPAAIVAALAIVATLVLFRRTMELSCDRLAARWVGLATAEQAFALVEAAQAQMRRGPVRTVWSRLSYPSPRRRLSACRTTRR